MWPARRSQPAAEGWARRLCREEAVRRELLANLRRRQLDQIAGDLVDREAWPADRPDRLAELAEPPGACADDQAVDPDREAHGLGGNRLRELGVHLCHVVVSVIVEAVAVRAGMVRPGP